jgi:hypothetical protein
MRRVSLAGLAAATLCSLAVSAHADERGSLAASVRDYDCTLTFPMTTYSPNSRNRPGSILEKLPKARIGESDINYILKPRYCVDETTALPDVTEGVDLEDYTQTTKLNASLTAEIEGLFKLFEVNYDNIADVQISLKNVKYLDPQSKVIARMAAAESKEPFCQANVINPSSSRIITSACVADITYKFYFKQGFDATLADAFIKAIKAKIGASLSYSKEIGQADKYVTVTSKKPVVIGINTEKTSDYFKSIKLPTQPSRPAPE